jgi:streptogramin lyase
MVIMKRSLLAIVFIAVLTETAQCAQKLLVASYLHNDVLAFDAQTGASLGIFVQPGTGGLLQPNELVIGPNSDVFVSCFSAHKVLRFGGQSGALVQTYNLPNSDSPRGIAFGPDGKLYVADTTSDTILRYDPATATNLGAFATSTGAPIGITFGPDGNLYAAVASTTQNAMDGYVQRFNGATGASLGPFASGHLDNPQALTFGPDGNLYVHSQYDWNIVRFNGTTGQFIDLFIDENYPYNPSSGIVFGPDGNLYTGNLTAGAPNDGVRRYNGSTGAFIDNFVPGDGTFWSTGLAFTPVPEPSSVIIGVIALGALFFSALVAPRDNGKFRKSNSAGGGQSGLIH